jgi:uncharacterized membrane protein
LQDSICAAEININYSHLHLLLNHFPIVGSILGCALFLISFFGKNDNLRRSSLIVFAAISLLTIPTFLTGVPAGLMIAKEPGVSDALVQRHEGAAMLSLWFMEATGALALIGLWQAHRKPRPARWNVIAVMVLSLVTVGLLARTGNTGGDIRHPELSGSQGAALTEGTAGSFVRAFEPTPEKFKHVIFQSQWSFPIMMILHFVGLVLIIGTVGILDIRIMGFLKELPIAPLHNLVPWAMVGLGINVVTGMLAFIAQPPNYIYSATFWLKMLSLLLLGLNLVAFYLTGIFNRIEHLRAGEDAPMAAKLVAGSSLFLWFAVITFARYIQPFAESIPHASK